MAANELQPSLRPWWERAGKVLWYTLRPAMAEGAIQSLQWLLQATGLVLGCALTGGVLYKAWLWAWDGDPGLLEMVRTFHSAWIGALILAALVLLGPLHQFAIRLRKAGPLEADSSAETKTPPPQAEEDEEDGSPDGGGH
jgi:hypothetical protein